MVNAISTRTRTRDKQKYINIEQVQCLANAAYSMLADLLIMSRIYCGHLNHFIKDT